MQIQILKRAKTLLKFSHLTVLKHISHITLKGAVFEAICHLQQIWGYTRSSCMCKWTIIQFLLVVLQRLQETTPRGQRTSVPEDNTIWVVVRFEVSNWHHNCLFVPYEFVPYVSVKKPIYVLWSNAHTVLLKLTAPPLWMCTVVRVYTSDRYMMDRRVCLFEVSTFKRVGCLPGR